MQPNEPQQPNQDFVPQPQPPEQPPVQPEQLQPQNQAFTNQPQQITPNPVQDYSQPYATQPAPQKTSGLVIAGFILAFIAPLIGLILSIIGFVKAGKSGGKKGLAVAGIIISVIMMIVNAVVAVLLISAASNAQDSAIETTDTARQNAALYNEPENEETPATTSASGAKAETLCYSLTLPQPHAEIDGDNSCSQRYAFGKSNIRTLRINPPVLQYRTFSESVAAFQRRNESDKVSEKATTLGGLKAHEIIYKGTSFNYKSVLVDVSGRNYKMSNVALTSLEFNSPYVNDEYSTMAQVDGALASVAWK